MGKFFTVEELQTAVEPTTTVTGEQINGLITELDKTALIQAVLKDTLDSKNLAHTLAEHLAFAIYLGYFAAKLEK